MKTLEEIKKATNLLVGKTAADGGTGVIFKAGKEFASVIWSNGGGWEHISIAPFNRRITPDWDDMCRLKDMFFYDDETVIQFHPAKSEYVNNVSNCLHLWRPINDILPTPPAIMVGIKKGQYDMLKKVQNWQEFNAIISDVMKTHKAYECSDCSFSGLGIISGNRESHCLEHAKDGKCRMYSRHKNKIDNLILKKQKED